MFSLSIEYTKSHIALILFDNFSTISCFEVIYALTTYRIFWLFQVALFSYLSKIAELFCSIFSVFSFWFIFCFCIFLFVFFIMLDRIAFFIVVYTY